MLFLMLVKVCVCRARSAAKAWLSALVTTSLRSDHQRVRVAAHEVAGDAADRDVAKCQLARPRLSLPLSSDRTLRRE